MSKVPHDSRTPHGELYRAFKEADAEIARLREAMIAEADLHDESLLGFADDKCTCAFCRIAREGR